MNTKLYPDVTMPTITNEQTLLGAVSRFNNAIRTYDDGFGGLWVYRESLGTRGIVRAQSFEDALECVYDAILSPIDESDLGEAFYADGELAEGYQFQANVTGTGIVAIDLNGEYLEPLTESLQHELGITVFLTMPDDEDC